MQFKRSRRRKRRIFLSRETSANHRNDTGQNRRHEKKANRATAQFRWQSHLRAVTSWRALCYPNLSSLYAGSAPYVSVFDRGAMKTGWTNNSDRFQKSRQKPSRGLLRHKRKNAPSASIRSATTSNRNSCSGAASARFRSSTSSLAAPSIATPCPRPHERRRTLRFSLGHVIEQAANVPLTPDSVIQAVRVFAHLDPEGRWVNPPKQRRTNISFLIADPTRVGVPCRTGFSQRRKVLVLYTSLHISAGEVSRIRAGHLQPICPNPS